MKYELKVSEKFELIKENSSFVTTPALDPNYLIIEVKEGNKVVTFSIEKMFLNNLINYLTRQTLLRYNE